MKNSLERQITRSTKIILSGASEDLSSPLFAINWFNTRWAWLYDFYNVLASRSLTGAGGVAMFKGRTEAILWGKPTLSRGHLLIVNYPRGEAFLNLLSGRYFQLISVIRMIAVQDFSFVMHRRLETPEVPPVETSPSENVAYAVMHFQSDETSSEWMVRVKSVFEGVTIHFASERCVTVASMNSSREINEMPYVTENVVLLRAPDAATLKRLTSSKAFAELTLRLNNLYVASINRTI